MNEQNGGDKSLIRSEPTLGYDAIEIRRKMPLFLPRAQTVYKKIVMGVFYTRHSNPIEFK